MTSVGDETAAGRGDARGVAAGGNGRGVAADARGVAAGGNGRGVAAGREDARGVAGGGETAAACEDARGVAAAGDARRVRIAGLAACAAMAAVGSSFAVLDGLHGYPAAGGQALRYAVGAILLTALAKGRLPRPTKRQVARLTALAATGLAAFNLLVLAAEDSMDPGSVGVIVATVPVILALAGPLQRGQRPQPRLIAAGGLVALGAAAVQGLGGELTAQGLAAALGALACEAAFSLLAAPLLQPLGAIATSAYAAALATPILTVTAAATTGFQTPTPSQLASLAWLATVVTALAFTLWYTAVKTLGVERAGLFSGVLPVAALLAAAALGDSRLTPGRAAGVAAVAAGIAAGMKLRC